jgi:hypothetical protein
MQEAVNKWPKFGICTNVTYPEDLAAAETDDEALDVGSIEDASEGG